MVAHAEVIEQRMFLQKCGMGVRGAAWATAGSQWLGAVALLATLQLVSEVLTYTHWCPLLVSSCTSSESDCTLG
jgi:hypothetical protein